MPLRRRYRFVIALAIALSALVPVLAYLHYRWLARLLEREQRFIQSHASSSVVRCARELDSALIATQRHFAVCSDTYLVDKETGELLFEEISKKAREEARTQIRLWQSNPNAGLLGAVWYVENPPDENDPVRYFALNFGPSNPAAGASPGAPRASLRDSLSFIAESSPPKSFLLHGFAGVVIPIIPIEPPPPFVLRQLRGATDYLAIEFNAAYLQDSLLPRILRRHCIINGSVPYLAQIIDRQSASVVAEGVALDDNAEENDISKSPSPLPQRKKEAFTANFGGLPKHPLQKTFFDDFTRNSGIAPAEGDYDFALLPVYGSLADEVERAQTENILLSFGATLFLGAGIVMLLFAALRAREISRQQTQFVAGVSHELRTPLAVLRAAADNLAHGVVQTPAAAREYGEMMRKEIYRLWEMIEQTLVFAGVQVRRTEIFTESADARELAAEALRLASMNPAAEGFCICFDAEPALPLIRANRSATLTALGNLLSNAIKYSARTIAENGGSVQPKRIILRLWRERDGKNDEVVIAVRDFGVGIAPKDRKRIFEPFYRAQSAEGIGGNGVGLALVQTIMNEHRGRVSVSSVVGEGSEFRLHFPTA